MPSNRQTRLGSATSSCETPSEDSEHSDDPPEFGRPADSIDTPSTDAVSAALERLPYDPEAHSEPIDSEDTNAQLHTSAAGRHWAEEMQADEQPHLIATLGVVTQTRLDGARFQYYLRINQRPYQGGRNARFAPHRCNTMGNPRPERVIPKLINGIAGLVAKPYGEGFRNIPMDDIRLRLPKIAFEHHPNPGQLADLVCNVATLEEHYATAIEEDLIADYHDITATLRDSGAGREERRKLKQAARVLFDIGHNNAMPDGYGGLTPNELHQRFEEPTQRKSDIEAHRQELKTKLDDRLPSAADYATRLLPDEYDGPMPRHIR